MGKGGPQKKPTQLAKLQGNPGRRPLNTNEPAPELPDGMPQRRSTVAHDPRNQDREQDEGEA